MLQLQDSGMRANIKDYELGRTCGAFGEAAWKAAELLLTFKSWFPCFKTK